MNGVGSVGWARWGCPKPAFCFGDGNCDGTVNWHDIDYFVAALNDNYSAWYQRFASPPPCTMLNLDVNGDGHVNWRDIDPFVWRLNVPCQ